MDDIILHEEPYGCLLLSPQVPCIIITWNGFANSTQFRWLMNRDLELYIVEAARTQPLGWLADTRDVSAVKEMDQEWQKNRLESAGQRGRYSPRQFRSARNCIRANHGAELLDQRHPIRHHSHLAPHLKKAKSWLKKQFTRF